ncbi:MAG: rhamnogalacturonan acetylesterase [Lachnospiraceae bacterium]
MGKIVYAGDSTAAFNKIDTYPQTGMSQGLLLYLKHGVEMKSFAANGRSTKSFIDEGRLEQIEQVLEQGDFLLIQFGHNDEKDDPLRHTDPDTTYQENLLKFVAAARRHGAWPVLITPIARRNFDENGKFLPGSHGAYPKAIKKAGAKCGVPVIDLTSVTEQYLAGLGDQESRPLFVWPKDNTHLKVEGAVIMAGFLSDGLWALGAPYADLLLEPCARE